MIFLSLLEILHSYAQIILIIMAANLFHGLLSGLHLVYNFSILVCFQYQIWLYIPLNFYAYQFLLLHAK